MKFPSVLASLVSVGVVGGPVFGLCSWPFDTKDP